MSLGLPEFGSRGTTSGGDRLWRIVQVAGLLVLAYSGGIVVFEGRAAYSADREMTKARAEVAQAAKWAEETRRTLQKNADALIATVAVESSLELVLTDLTHLLPQGVSILGLKIEYLADATTRLDFNVVAGTPGAYDRFLSALSKSEHFTQIKPGAESRPGLIRATVMAIYRSKARPANAQPQKAGAK